MNGNPELLWQMRLVTFRACQLAIQAELKSPIKPMFAEAAEWAANVVELMQVRWPKLTNEEIAFELLKRLGIAKRQNRIFRAREE